MTTEFVAVPADLTAGATIDRLRELEPDAETIYYVYVVDDDGRLVGVLSLRDLIVAQPATPIGEVMIDEPVAVERPGRPRRGGRGRRPLQPAGRAGRRRRRTASSGSSPSTTRSTPILPRRLAPPRVPRPVGRDAGAAGPDRCGSAVRRSPCAARRSRDCGSARDRSTCLRLRGRFRGRRGLVAFLAVMGPGLIAGIAGNDAGGITTYSVHRRPDRADPAVDLPDHDRHPGHRPGDGGPARRRHRAGPVGPHPRPVRRPLDGVRDGRAARRQRRQHGRRVLRGGGGARDLRDLALPRRCRSSAVAIWALVIKASYRTVERVFLSVIVVFFAYIVVGDPGRSRTGARSAGRS